MSTHNIPFSIYKKKITLNYAKSASMGFFSTGLKNEFETAIVNKPLVFEPLKFYCISYLFSEEGCLCVLGLITGFPRGDTGGRGG